MFSSSLSGNFSSSLSTRDGYSIGDVGLRDGNSMGDVGLQDGNSMGDVGLRDRDFTGDMGLRFLNLLVPVGLGALLPTLIKVSFGLELDRALVALRAVCTVGADDVRAALFLSRWALERLFPVAGCSSRMTEDTLDSRLMMLFSDFGR